LTSLILASQSTTRARLLSAALVPFDIVPAHVDEIAVKESLLAERAIPPEIAEKLAELKARKVSSSHPSALVLGADQILVFSGEVIRKSRSTDEARALLTRLAGQTHALIAAVVLAKDGMVVWRHTDQAELQMRKMSDAFLNDYLVAEGEDILGSVGCYRLEGGGAQLFSRISGDYFTVLGLPLLPLLGALREFGVLPT
jgi:septum formation protein